MVKVEIGTIVPKDTIKQGQTGQGTIWLVGQVKADKGYDNIKVWANNAEQMVARDCDFKVVEIIDATIKNHKYTAKDGTEKWATDYNVNAKLEPCESNLKPAKDDIPSGFTPVDDDLPF